MIEVAGIEFDNVTQMLLYVVDNFFLEDVLKAAERTRRYAELMELERELQQALMDNPEAWGIYQADITVAEVVRTGRLARHGFALGLFDAFKQMSDSQAAPLWEDAVAKYPNLYDPSLQRFQGEFSAALDSDAHWNIYERMSRIVEDATTEVYQGSYQRGFQVAELMYGVLAERPVG